jgi:CRP-like cAMP-binding protein
MPKPCEVDKMELKVAAEAKPFPSSGAELGEPASRHGHRLALSTPEKVIVLRSVGLFAEAPEPILAEVAGLLDETVLAADETIFDQGDRSDAMYIIVEGRVRVHSGGRTLTVMERNSVFGEMGTALDPEPRSASVTALEDVRLLRLERAHLYRLITSSAEVSSGVIHILCRHLRESTASMVEDYHYLQQVERLTAAAAAVESGIYKPESVDEVAQRSDALGQLARVFQRMIREVHVREQRLHHEVHQLSIEIDRRKTARQVAEITETDYFRALQEKARDLRTYPGVGAGPERARQGSGSGWSGPGSADRGDIAGAGATP